MAYYTIDTLRETNLQIDGGSIVDVTGTGGIRTSNLGIYATGSSVLINVEGTVRAAGTAGLVCGLLLGGSGEDGISIASTGQVFGSRAGIKSYSLTTVVNLGRIESDEVAIEGLNGLEVDNQGAVRGGRFGIELASVTSDGQSLVTNSGWIYGGTRGVDGSVGADRVINTGLIEGQLAVSLREGDDVYDGRNGGTTIGAIDLGAGRDTAWGGAGIETIHAGAGDDLLSGQGGADALRGEDGNDWLEGGTENDSLEGGADDDVLAGDAGADRLDGGSGSDFVWYSTASLVGVDIDLSRGTGLGGEAQGDTFLGIEGVFGSYADDVIAGNDSDNTLNGGGNVFAPGGAPDGGDDKLYGRGGNDSLNGEGGHDTLDGGAGDDTLTGGHGNDSLDGGTGRNTAQFSGARENYSVVRNPDGSCTVTDMRPGKDGTDILRNIEFVTLGGQTYSLDRLAPVPAEPTPPQNLVLIGTSRADRLIGQGGDDRLSGKGGKDSLTGDAGRDVFVFAARPDKRTNLDTIRDFSAADDAVWLDKKVFAKLGRKGTEANPAPLSKKFFHIGAKAKDADDYLVYNRKTGILSYDQDGSGTGKAIAIAKLANKAQLTKDDFFVI
jgi:Ca2+-binding RTX toxin-like protein